MRKFQLPCKIQENKRHKVTCCIGLPLLLEKNADPGCDLVFYFLL